MHKVLLFYLYILHKRVPGVAEMRRFVNNSFKNCLQNVYKMFTIKKRLDPQEVEPPLVNFFTNSHLSTKKAVIRYRQNAPHFLPSAWGLWSGFNGIALFATHLAL